MPGRDAHIAGQSELAAPSQSNAVDDSDRGLRALSDDLELISLNAAHRNLRALGGLVGFAHLFQIDASTESQISRAPDGDHPDVIVATEIVEYLYELSTHGSAQCISALGAVDNHGRHMLMDVNNQSASGPRHVPTCLSRLYDNAQGPAS